MVALNQLGTILGQLDGTLPCLPPKVTLSSPLTLLVLPVMDKNLPMLSRAIGEEVSFFSPKSQACKRFFY